MITIKLIPNIINNKDRKIIKIKFENKSLIDIINNIASKSKVKLNVIKIIINGKRIEDLQIKPQNKDEIIIVYAIEGQEDWIAGITIVASVVGAILFPAAAAGLYISAGLTALSWGYSKIVGQRKPSYGSAGNEIDASSPTYGWDGIENTQAAGLPLAIIYGENKVGGNLINLNMTGGGLTPTYITVFSAAVQGTDYSASDTGVSNQQRIVTYTTLKKVVGFKINVTSYRAYNAELGLNGAYFLFNVQVAYKKTSDSEWITQGVYRAPSTPYGSDYAQVTVVGLDEDYYNIRISFQVPGSLPGNPQTTTRMSGSVSNFQLGAAIYESIENNQKLNMLLALGEGEIEDIYNIFINDNPISNFKDSEYEIRKGSVNQSLINVFQNLNNFFQIASKVLKDTPYNYTTYNNKITGFEINFVFPSGIWSTNDNGAYNSWSVTLVVGYKLVTDENYTEQTVTFNYKTRNVYRNTIKKIDLTAGQYEIRISKTTNDPDNQYTFGDCQVMTINEIKQQSLTYPNTALLAVSVKASEQISNTMPTITSVVKGKKILCPVITDSNNEVVDYDNYYYDDEDNCYRSILDDSALSINQSLSSFTEKYNANPIWCLFDLLTHKRYGLGNYISADDIDIDSFLDCAKYCDTLIENSLNKKLRLDIVFDSISSAIDIIQQITQAFRGFVFFTTGKIKAVIDKPQAVTQMFSMGNIIDGSFNVSKRSNKDFCNSIDIVYYDKKNDYKQDVVTVEDQNSIDEIGIRSKSIRVFSNNEEYAKLAGEYFLRQDKYINEIISFKAAVDAVMCQPGDVIAVCHDNNSFNKSGRVISYEDGVITVDCDLTIEEDKTYKIQIKLSDDTIVEKDVLNSESGTTREIEVEDDFTLDPQGYDIFSFYESTKEIKKYRITNMKKDEDLNIDITAIEYNEKVYGIDNGTEDTKETKYNIDSKGGLQFYNYISAQGNAYIDPDIIASDVGKIEVNGIRISNPQSLSCVFGFFDSLNNATGLWLNGDFITRNWGGSSSTSDSNNPYRLSYKFGSHVSNFTNKVFIFATQNSSDEMSNFSNNNAKLSSLKFYDAEGVNVIADLQPATYNGVPGMYDNIRKKFFINANSSGKLIIDGIIQEQEEKMVKIVDLSADPQINRSVNLMEVAQSAGGRTDGVSFLARGTVTSGEIKLLGSLDGTNWFNLQDEEGKDVVLHVGVFTELKIRNRFVKCDLTDVTSSNLIVEVQ